MNTQLRRRCTFLLFTAFLSVIAGTARFAPGQVPFTDSATNPQKPNAITQAVSRGTGMSNLYHAGNRMETARLDVTKLLEADADHRGPGPKRMGVVQELEVTSDRDGQWTQLDDGWLWTTAFHAPDAAGIRLRIRSWEPPGGAELIMYDARNRARCVGPLTCSDRKRAEEFWTPTVYSDEIHVEYFLPEAINRAAPSSQVTVDALLNQYIKLAFSNNLAENAPQTFPCHPDVSCYPSWANEAAGVGILSWVSGPFGFFCSGNMMNRIPQDFTPLFQTARHCGVTENNVASLLVTWFYQTPACNGTPPNPNTLPQTPGVALLVNDSSADYTLIGLASQVPAGVFYLGWDAAYWPNSSAATGIHHPGGSYKRIHFGLKTGDHPCAGGDGWETIQAPGDGLVEPGSSGSPVFDVNHRVRGTASGCGNAGCGIENRAVYGRFDLAWPMLQPFLQPTDPGDIYVNTSFGGTELGTVVNPFTTVAKGMFAVARGQNVHIEGGTYTETFTIDKAMTLSSRNGTVVIGQ
jgi:hypothetical protein